MIDIYIDDVTLAGISIEDDEQILIFKNKEKDESLMIPVSNEELTNIFQKVKNRCETLNLVQPYSAVFKSLDREELK